MLKISKDLSLPINFVTQVCAILARRGAGKTYTANVLSEEMLKNGMQVCVIDPLGVWHGLRASADGKREGYPVVIFGGEHEDLPLDSAAGGLIADVVVEKKISAVIDLSLMRKAEQERFVTAFIERVYFKNRTPLHLMVDEADSWCPQRPMPQQMHMVGAMEDVVRRGRSKGLGMTMITQRTASINKNILSQAEILICLQTSSPHDLKAVEDWIQTHGTKEQCDTMLGSMPSLPRGRAWVCSPQSNLFKMVDVRTRETFDSSSTPQIGEKKIVPKMLAAVDIETIKGQMSDLVEAKKADDPKELRKQIADLQKELAAKPKQLQPIEVPILDPELLNFPRRLEKIRQDYNSAYDLAIASFLHRCEQMKVQKYKPTIITIPKGMEAKQIIAEYKRTPPVGKITNVSYSGSLTKMARAILIVLKQFPHGKTKSQIAVLAGYRMSGSFSNAMSEVRTRGLIESHGDLMIATADGRNEVANVQDLPTGRDLAQHWLAQLGNMEKTILEFLISNYPHRYLKTAIADACGYKVSGSFSNAISYLNTSELIQKENGEIRASDVLI